MLPQACRELNPSGHPITVRGPVQHPRSLQQFVGGKETRQLFALDTKTERIIQIAEGAAEALRADCRSGRLVCPIESCETRAFTTVGGSRRHHFRHRLQGAGRHGRESYYHQLGKSLIAQHFTDRYPHAEVDLETEAGDNAQRPDILVAFPDGSRFAIELQYSPLTIAAWRARHEGYRRHGVTDIWLFGHLPPHLRTSRYHRDERFAGAIGVTELARAVTSAGLPVRFFSPDERTVATALVESGNPLLRAWGAAELAFVGLEECELRNGLWTPVDDAEEAARRACEERLLRQAQEQRRWEREDARRRAEQARREHDRDKIDRWKRRKHDEAERMWKEHSEARFLALVGLPETPSIIERELRADRWIHRHPAHWHAQIYWEFLHGRVGQTFTFGKAVRRFYAAQPKNRHGANVALAGFLFELRRNGYVAFDSLNTWIEGEIIVLADITAPPQPSWGHVRLVEREHDLVAIAETGELLAVVS